MYRDNADWRYILGLSMLCIMNIRFILILPEQLSQSGKFTKETFYSCYETFYHPSNMFLFVVGGVEAGRGDGACTQQSGKKII